MARYVDVDALEKEGWFASRNYQQDEKIYVYETKKLSEMPTADVVEVVRCSECKHHTYEEPGMVYCQINIYGGWVANDFYCGDGERGE